MPTLPPRACPRVSALVAFAVCLALAPSLASAPAATRAADRARFQNAAPPRFTIQTRVPLTIVDVTVTDAKGNPVRGLKQSDFTILEDGEPMEPNSFEEHRSDVAPPAPALVKPDLPPNTFTNTTPVPPKAGPLNILVLDNLNTPLANQRILQQHMLEFVDKLSPETRMAVFNLSEFHLSVLQGFTSDHDLLKAAINSKKVTGQIPPIEDLWQDKMNPTLASIDPDEEECNKAAMRAQDTISAMKQISRYLSGMPGRKNLLWFSGSFPLMMDAHGANCYDINDELKAADDQLARSHVTVYPADPRALDLFTNSEIPKIAVARQATEHLTMEAIAEQTGGKALYNSNALDVLAEAAIDNGSNYYTITYAPTNQTLDTRFRTISVKVDQPGLNLTYRNGYYATEPNTDARGKKIETVSPMLTALMRGALDATQILFKVRAVQGAATEVSLPLHNEPDPKQMKPPYRHYSITYTIDIGNIQFTQTPDGNYRSAFEYGIRVYNADGDEIVNSISTTVRPIVPPAVYQSMLKTGAIANNEIDVPANGDYFLRIAVHDLTTDRVGALEIPTASIRSDPVPAVASGSNP